MIRYATAGLLALVLSAPALAGGASVRPGIGAIPYTDGGVGVTFRVWAPNADAVSVVGSFNGWSVGSDPMFDEGDGYWSVDRAFVFPGAQYRYAITNGANTEQKNDARARRLVNSNGPSLVYAPDAYVWNSPPFATPAWNETVVYEMHIGTFNLTGGSVPANFSEATQRLDYLADLGINMIEVMPVQEFPGDISWGYNPSHPFSVESAYGGPDQLKQFIDEAHARGIAVVLDIVHNHYGPTDLDLWRYDGWSSGGWGGIFFFNDWRAVTPWGDTRPDFSKDPVRQYIRDSALLWIEEFRADGLRFDAVQYMRKADPGGPDLEGGWSLLQWINDEIDIVAPGALSIAEDLAQEEWITKTTGVGGAGFDTQASTFFRPIRDTLISPSDNDRNMWSVRDAITNSFNGDWLDRIIYTENHDEVANGHSRLPEEIWPGNADSWYSRKRSTLGAAIVMTAPGIPMIFQGQELLEDAFFTDVDPVDWSRLTTYAGIHQLYRDLIHLRRNLDGVSRGLSGANLNVHHVNNTDKVLAYHRWKNGGVGDDVIVMTSFANADRPDYRIGLPHAGTWYVVFNSDSTLYGDDYGNYGPVAVEAEATAWDGMPFSAPISIGAYDALILSQEPLETPPPSADLDGDGQVGFGDLVILLAAWGTTGPGDLDENGSVGFGDLVILLGSWGA